MRNGGGPACLRLRVVLRDEELSRLQGNVLLSDSLAAELHRWIERHYRTELHPADLHDPSLAEESAAALEDLEQILQIPLTRL